MPMSAAAISSQARTHGKVPRPAPPYCSGYGQPGQPQLPHPVEQGAVVALLLVALRDRGRQLALGELGGGVADGALLLRQGERVGAAGRGGAGNHQSSLLPFSS